MLKRAKDLSEMEEKEYLETHEELVKTILDRQPADEVLYDLAELFKVFGDSTRIKILYAMFDTELCVNDIARLLSLSQSSVSHQLRILKSSKLVKFRREGKSVFYSLDDEHVRSILSMGMEHVFLVSGKKAGEYLSIIHHRHWEWKCRHYPPSSRQTLSQSCKPLFFLGAMAARHSFVACS